MNSINTDRDIFTMLHECGHAIHQFMSRQNALPYNREAPMEFNEVASMGMERLGMAHLDVFFNRKNAARAICYQEEEVFRLLIWIAIVDSFQHWLYTHPDHTRTERNRIWIVWKYFPMKHLLASPFYALARYCYQFYGALTSKGAAGKSASQYSIWSLIKGVIKAYISAFGDAPRVWQERPSLDS